MHTSSPHNTHAFLDYRGVEGVESNAKPHKCMLALHTLPHLPYCITIKYIRPRLQFVGLRGLGQQVSPHLLRGNQS